MSLANKVARARTQGGLRGNVASGDPGLFGGIIGAIRGGVSSLISGGNPIAGAISGGVRGFKGAPTPEPVPPVLTAGRVPAMPRSTRGLPVRRAVPVAPVPGVGGMAQRFLPGGRTGYQVELPPPTTNGAPKASMRGYRLNKTGYYLKDGTYVAPGTKWVKIRRRNSMNPRALSRAIARVDGAKAIQAKLAQIGTKKYTPSGKRRSCS